MTQPQKPPDPDYNGTYHALFSHAAMVRSLLECFVPQDVVATLDFEQMERLNVSFVGPGLAERRGDDFWRIPLVDQDAPALYVCVLLEFQSTRNYWMSLRMLVYVGLLYQQLLEQGAFDAKSGLPPVLPLVLYNGEEPWTQPLALESLSRLPAQSTLWPWQPSMAFYLVDVGRQQAEDLQRMAGLVPRLFELEQCQSTQELDALVDDILEVLRELVPEHTRRALSEAFTTFIAEVLYKRGIEVEPDRVDDLREFKKMFARNVEKWTEQWKRDGLEQGLEQGQLDSVRLMVEQRLSRPLAAEELERLKAHLHTEGLEAVIKTALESSPEGVAGWLGGGEVTEGG